MMPSLSALIHVLPFCSAALASSITCNHPTLSSPHDFDIPSWQSSNFSCTGPPQPFTVRSSPGKGLGVFATQTLEPGDMIIQEEPVIKITPPEFRDGVGYPLDAIGMLAREAFESLTDEVQSEVLSLHAHMFDGEKSNADYEQLISIFRSNAYNTGKQIGLFPKVARINHSCRPNTSYFWSERLNKRIVYATRRIEEGEELSVTYIPLLLSQANRQRRLNQYGFQCSCEACAAKQEEMEASDQRRKDIRHAFTDLEPQLTLDAPTTVAAKKKARKMAKEGLKLAQLVEEEGLADYYAQAYRVVAITHARIKDWETAATWAHKSYQIRMMADAHAEETQEIEALTGSFIASWNDSLRKSAK